MSDLRSHPFAVVSLVAVLLAGAPPSLAVLLERGDETPNAEAPEDDPGWGNVGQRGFWSCVYLGNRWVITARHVPVGDVTLGGRSYAAEKPTIQVIENANHTATDLVVFRLSTDPGLPGLSVAHSPPELGTPLVMAGRGRRRGEKIRWSVYAGFRWDPQADLRWGTSSVHARTQDLSIRNTRTFSTRFSIAGSLFEAQATRGDSGGPVFAKHNDRWELVGIMLAIDLHPGQPKETALYGNRTFIADLSQYHEKIEAIVAARGTDPR